MEGVGSSIVLGGKAENVGPETDRYVDQAVGLGGKRVPVSLLVAL